METEGSLPSSHAHAAEVCPTEMVGVCPTVIYPRPVDEMGFSSQDRELASHAVNGAAWGKSRSAYISAMRDVSQSKLGTSRRNNRQGGPERGQRR